MPAGSSELRQARKGAQKSSVTSRLCVLQSNNISGGRQLVSNDKVAAWSRVLHKTSRRHVETGDDARETRFARALLAIDRSASATN